MALRDPVAYPPLIEGGHFLLVAIMMPAVSLLAGRLSRMRHRSRLQRAELAQALSRLREHTTRDELTGLINRREFDAAVALIGSIAIVSRGAADAESVARRAAR